MVVSGDSDVCFLSSRSISIEIEMSWPGGGGEGLAREINMRNGHNDNMLF